ncbi:MAG: hypothetical protein K6E19_01920 [Lachnospiraceae bacterium]|nr:hypothetical protein [Lachnospiraceae bacterium]
MYYSSRSVFHCGDEVVYEPVPACAIKGIVISNRGDGVYEIRVDEKHSMMANACNMKLVSKSA